MLEASRSQTLRRLVSFVRQTHCWYMMEMMALHSDPILPIDKLVSRTACRMSDGHSSSNSRRSSPSSRYAKCPSVIERQDLDEFRRVKSFGS